MMKKNQAFTLIEISIVLVVIGLLTAAILKGQQMIDNSRYRAWVKEVDTWRVAFHSFQDQYGYYPGDYPRAEEKFTRDSQIAVKNGNGDGVINHASGVHKEPFQAYIHLLQAGLISGHLGEIPVKGSGTYLLLPSAAGSGFISGFSSYRNPGSGHQRTWIMHHHFNAGYAQRYDEAFDDGQADSGDVVCWAGFDSCAGSSWPDESQTVSVFIAVL